MNAISYTAFSRFIFIGFTILSLERAAAQTGLGGFSGLTVDVSGGSVKENSSTGGIPGTVDIVIGSPAEFARQVAGPFLSSDTLLPVGDNDISGSGPITIRVRPGRTIINCSGDFLASKIVLNDRESRLPADIELNVAGRIGVLDVQLNGEREAAGSIAPNGGNFKLVADSRPSFLVLGVTASGGDGKGGSKGSSGGRIYVRATRNLNAGMPVGVSLLANGGRGGDGDLEDLSARLNGGDGGDGGVIKVSGFVKIVQAFARGGDAGDGSQAYADPEEAEAYGGDINGFGGGNGGYGGCITFNSDNVKAESILSVAGGNGGHGGDAGWGGGYWLSEETVPSIGGTGGLGGKGGKVGGLSDWSAIESSPVTAAIGLLGGKGGNGGRGGRGGVAQNEMTGVLSNGALVGMPNCSARSLDGGTGGRGGDGGDSPKFPGEAGIGGTGGGPGLPPFPVEACEVGNPGEDGEDGDNGANVGASSCEHPKILVFVPGIAASSLTSADGSTDLWVSYFNIDLMLMDTSPNAIAKDVLRDSPIQTYGNLIRLMKSEGYVEHDTVGKPQLRTISGMKQEFGEHGPDMPHKPNLFIFPYDWRKSNKESASQLGDYIDGILWLHPGASIDFIGHSMGGLVIRRYLIDSKATQQAGPVRRVATIGSPFLGTPAAINRVLWGDFFSNGESDGWIDLALLLLDRLPVFGANPDIRNVLPGFQSFHEILPSRTYFDFYPKPTTPDIGDTPPIRESGADFNDNRNSYDQFDFRDFAALKPFSKAASNNDQFHQGAQDDWSEDTSSVEYLTIAGMQDQNRTVVTVEIDWYYPWIPSGWINLPKPMPRALRGPGDGTVSILSALRSNHLVVPNKQKQVVIRGPNTIVDHTKLAGHTQVHDLLRRFLRDGLEGINDSEVETRSGLSLMQQPNQLSHRIVRLIVPRTGTGLIVAGNSTSGSGSVEYQVSEAIFYDEVFTGFFSNTLQGAFVEVEEFVSGQLSKRMSYNFSAGTNVYAIRSSPAGLSLANVMNINSSIPPDRILEGELARDRIAPKLAFSIQGRFVTFKASDMGSGVEAILIQRDSNGLAPYSAPIDMAGLDSLKAFAVDRSGNYSAVTSLPTPLKIIASDNHHLAVQWIGPQFQFETSRDLKTWAASQYTVSTTNGTNTISLGTPSGSLFYRLKK